jgi:putative tricarboxylic transport membrane protein
MSDETHAGGGTGPTHRSVEIGVAVAMIVFSLIVIYGSILVGIGWASDGPRAGFFPFYCGAAVLIASSINLFNGLSDRGAALFAEWGQLARVMQVVVPGAVYVALVPWLGMYVSSALLIAVFMRWIGKYNWTMIALIPVPVMVGTFFIFEKWFLVSLPKGPLEDFLGL